MADGQHHFEELYAKGIKPWDSGVPSQALQEVLEAGGFPSPPARLLELGCGTGTNAIELARRGYTVTAADFVAAVVETARAKAASAKVSIDFRVADVTRDDLGGPYDILFDRGVYHHIRTVNLAGFQSALRRLTRPGSRWLSLAGNANEQGKREGPPRVHEHEIRAELGGLFEILRIGSFRFGTDCADFRPLAWCVLMERKREG